MSRIGRKPIEVPSEVKVTIDGNFISVTGTKGTLEREIHKNISISMEDNVIFVTRPNDEKQNRALHGLSRALINNMVVGVSTGFTKELEINGVGYRAAKQGNDLVMNLGYSHQVIIPEIPGISITVASPTRIIIGGPDKQVVGQFAHEVRSKRPPEPYKGKGIKYIDEYIIRKEGKAGKGGKK